MKKKTSKKREVIIGQSNIQSEGWLDVPGIAQHLGVSKETIYRMLKSGSIPASRIGKLWKFKASEVDSKMGYSGR